MNIEGGGKSTSCIIQIPRLLWVLGNGGAVSGFDSVLMFYFLP